MEISETEWHLLNILVRSKKPSSRTSILNLSSIHLTLKTAQVLTADLITKSLEALEVKGLIKVVRREERATSVIDPVKEVLTLNQLFITQRISQAEYERQFMEIKRKQAIDNQPISSMLSLTSLARFLVILRLTTVEDEFRSIAEDCFKTLLKYLDAVKNIIDASQDKPTAAIAFLYPFFMNLMQIDTTTIKDITGLRKQISLENEIILALKRINADQNVVQKHLKRLKELTTMLNEQEAEIMGVASVDRRFHSSVNPETLFEQIRDFLMKHGTTQWGYYELGSSKFNELALSRISSIVASLFMTYIQPYLVREGSIQFKSHIDEPPSKDGVEVYLSWLNDECHVMQDSIIDSDGTELDLCPNKKCLIAYHKTCLEVLRRSQHPYCLVCSAKII